MSDMIEYRGRAYIDMQGYRFEALIDMVAKSMAVMKHLYDAQPYNPQLNADVEFLRKLGEASEAMTVLNLTAMPTEGGVQ